MSDPTTETQQRWLGPGVAGIGTASFLADVGHEIPTALLPTCSPPPSACRPRPRPHRGRLGRAGRRVPAGRWGHRRRPSPAPRPGGRRVHGHCGALQPDRGGHHRLAGWGAAAGAWAARSLRVPARNALLADIVRPASTAARMGSSGPWTTSGPSPPCTASQARTAHDRSWGVHVSRADGLLPPSRPAAPSYVRSTPRGRGRRPPRSQTRPPR
jgi:hypothetical protein